MDRRRFLKTAGAVSTTALAGCLGGGSDSGVSHETIQMEPSFIADMAITPTDMGQRIEAVLRHNDGNFRMDMAGMEMYNIDGDVYVVTPSRCFKNASRMQEQLPVTGGPTRPENHHNMLSDAPTDPDRRETIDGEEMLVFVISDDSSAVTQKTTVYVSAETNYPRRMESDRFTIRYHSYGDVKPITPPEMDCTTGAGGGDF